MLPQERHMSFMYTCIGIILVNTGRINQGTALAFDSLMLTTHGD